MKFINYLKDKFLYLLIVLISYILIILLLRAFKACSQLLISISLIILVSIILIILIDYFRKKFFYDNFLSNLEKLDKKYLIIETINKPNFYEGELLYNSLYDINKSMCDNVKKYKLSINDFKDYIEMWIHEVKIPLASLNLITHNHKKNLSKKIEEQINIIDNYTEQVLYYVRSENAEKDYLIKETQLTKIISNLALKNKDYLLENNVDLIVENINYKVLTDSKWLEFILNQIINNSIKYKDDKKSPYIKITTSQTEDHTILSLTDNGIGIPSSDLPKVFDKSFTGKNGRIKNKSTGMGLYIAKKLCNKLSHKIEITSKENKYTKVSIIFYKNKYYEVIK